MKKILIFSMAAILLIAFSGLNYAVASGEIKVAKEEVGEKARKEAEKKAKKEKKARKKAEEKARKEAEKKAKAEKKAEEKARKEAEKKAKAEEKARKKAEEKARKEAEKKAKEPDKEKAKAEEKARKEAEKKAKEEEKARKKAEEKARKEAEKKAKAEEKARKEEEKARKKAEEKAKKEAEEKAKEAEKAKKEAEKANKEAEKKAKEAEEARVKADKASIKDKKKAQKEADKKAKAAGEARKKAEMASMDADRKAIGAAEARKKAEMIGVKAEEKPVEVPEEKVEKELDEKARKKAEKEAKKKAKEEEKAGEKARKEAEKKAKKEEEARKKAEKKARKEAEKKARKRVPAVKKKARPNAAAIGGKTGLIRTISVKTLDQGIFRLNTHLEYFYAKRRLSYVAPGDYPVYENVESFPNEKSQRLEGTAGISYGVYQWKKYPLSMEVTFAGTGYSHSLVSEEGGKSLVQSLGDLEMGAKLAYGLDEGIGLGLDTSLQFLTKSGDIGYRGKATSAEFKLLSTFELAEIKNFPFENFPLTIHLNFGGHLDNSDEIRSPGPYSLPEAEYALGIIRESQFLLNFAAEYPLDTIGSIGRLLKKNYLNFYLEYSVEDILGSDFGRSFSESNQRITLGPRLFLLENQRLAVDLMFDIGLSKLVSAETGGKVSSEPGWRIISGLSYTFLPAPKVAVATTGRITGKVTDAKTGKSIEEAIISFPGTGLSSVLTDADGRYISCEIEAGEIEVVASRDGYLSQSEMVMVEVAKTVTQDFKLKKLVEVGILIGKVTDAKIKPLAAVISFDKPITSVATDLTTGEYKAKLPPGEYKVTATAERYKPQTKPAIIKDKKTTRVNFVLELIVVAPPKKPLAILRAKKIEILEKIHFETAKSVLLAASYPILDDVAKILIEHPRVKILIEGHTDSVGSETYNLKLSQSRAESVMRYLLDKGVPGARLKAAGFGESTPIADNTTASGRARNRRVEFTIISR